MARKKQTVAIAASAFHSPLKRKRSWDIALGKDPETTPESNFSTYMETIAPLPISSDRKLWHLGDSSEPSEKKAKLDPQERIKDLEAQISELHKYILSEKSYTDIPLSIRKHFKIEPGHEKFIYQEIRKSINRVVEPLWGEEANYRKTGVTSDDISSAVYDFIPKIRELAEMEDGLELAFGLVLYLGENSYGENRSGYGSRPSDAPADVLLVEIAKRMKIKNEDFAPAKELKSLRKQAKDLDDFGIEGFFQMSIALFSEYCGEN